jgi:hypothetical protein
MKTIPVYRVDYVRKLKVPIGSVVERREKERGDNIIGLLRMARNSFSSSPEEALHIAIDASSARAS